MFRLAHIRPPSVPIALYGTRQLIVAFRRTAPAPFPEPDESNADRHSLFHNYVPSRLIVAGGVLFPCFLYLQPQFEAVCRTFWFCRSVK
jgi:hypothetical protein